MVTMMMMKAMMVTCSPLLLLGLAAAQASAGSSSYTSSSPRVKVSYTELQQVHGVQHFELGDSCCYSALLLDEERERLFVGARNYLLSLSMENIANQELKIHWPAKVEWREECDWASKNITTACHNFIKILHNFNQTHLLACGTGAFHPTCAYVEVGTKLEDHVLRMDPSLAEEGRGRSPYNATHQTASVLIGGELYSGVAIDLVGRDFTIFRSLGKNPFMRTDEHNSLWLNEPKFVESFWVPETDNPDDDKIFFFFHETALEVQGLGKSTYSRIAQMCRNDMGGQWSLVNRWTTFQKTRLVCSVPGADGRDSYFDELRDVFLLQTEDRKRPLVFAVFTTPSSSLFRGSAVCIYSMDDIRRAFLGPFAHKEGPNYKWVEFRGKVPYPRPGMCPSETHGDFESTQSFPEDVLRFAQIHPLMHNPVYPVNRRPVFVQTNVDYSFTQITVDRVTAADGQYDVMFIGTDKGTVLKVINVPKEDSTDIEELLLEELEIFKDKTPVINMKISSKRQQLYVSSNTGMAQVPLHMCSTYGKTCAECCLARDPYCAWDGKSCTLYLENTKRPFLQQDVRNGDPNTLCSGEHNELLNVFLPHEPIRLITPMGKDMRGSSTFLECQPKSLHAMVHWTFQRNLNSPQDEVRIDDRLQQIDQGLLFRRVLKTDVGMYQCHATEHGITQTLLSIKLEVISSTTS